MKFKTFSNVYNVKDKNVKSIKIYLVNFEENNLIFSEKDIYSMNSDKIEMYNYIADNEEILCFKVDGTELKVVIK